MPENNTNLSGPECRFLIRILTDQRMMYRPPGLFFVSNLLSKLNDLHINQPTDVTSEEAITHEQAVLTSFVIEKGV